MGRTALVKIVALALAVVAAADDTTADTTTAEIPVVDFTGEPTTWPNQNQTWPHVITLQEGTIEMLEYLEEPVVTQGDDVLHPTEAPYLVRLLLCGTDALCYTCGGTWISHQDIMTAAHCLPDTPGTLYFYRNDIPDRENQRHTSVSGTTTSYTVHPDWEGKTKDGADLAILHVTPQSVVTPIHLATQDEFDVLQQNFDTLVVYGFGELSNGGDAAQVLQKSKPLAWLDCFIMNEVGYYVKADERSYRFPTGIPAFICFEPSAEGSDMCKGDSGGPLMKDGIQFGINSFVYGACGQYPSVDTNVAHYHDWIVANSEYDPDGSHYSAEENQVTSVCDDKGCSHYCFETDDNVAVCACPINLTIDTANTTNCIAIGQNLVWSDNVIREDGSIRPYSDPTQCWYHKMNGYTTDEAAGQHELVYTGDCVSHSRYRWFFEENGLIMNQNRYDTTPHCITIPDVDAFKKKQQPYLGPCDANRIDQLWQVEEGQIRLRYDTRTCLRWNLGTKTRLWTLPCDEMHFAQLVQE
jgi:trypsin